MASEIGQAELHKYCREGQIRKIKEWIESIDNKEIVKDMIENRFSVFSYTLVHEAVCNNKPEIISYLIQQGANVNSRANSGYTPLHLAVSAGYTKCVRVLIDNGADLYAKDEYGKTPRQTASLVGRSNKITTLLLNEEIIEEVKANRDAINALSRISPNQLLHDTLDRALVAAVENGHHTNAAKLIIKGAKHTEKALELSKKLEKYNIQAMLLLLKAARTNDKLLVMKLFGETVDHPLADYYDFHNVQKVVCDATVPTMPVIGLAQRCKADAVYEELLLHTDVKENRKTVSWHALHLFHLELSWFERISWVEFLSLARNRIITIPNNIELHLQNIIKLNLSNNELVEVPESILSLPKLQELLLSYNLISNLPSNWSLNLQILDIAHNELTDLPDTVLGPALHTLNLSSNKFTAIPVCVFSFAKLSSLYITCNTINVIPEELKEIVKINID